jgi:putative transposase
MTATEQLAKDVGVRQACDALGVPRASFYRRRQWQAASTREATVNRSSPRALTAAERGEVRQTLYSDRFMDKSPYQVYASLLDDGDYLCSVRTMYRILADDQASRERRNQLRRPHYKKPELLATRSNQVWSWDITKLKGPEKWTYYYLYVILDIYSRYVVGWMLAHREQADLATKLIRETIKKQGVCQDELIVHSDRGPSMTSHSVAQLLISLGVCKSHSRPHVSNDNPYSESQFKTMKYRADFPDRFGCYEDGLGFCRKFFNWYNDEHYHSGIGYVTPASLHYGDASSVVAAREQTLQLAYAAHPERFVQGAPKPPQLPSAVWINPPSPTTNANEKRLPEINCPQKPQEEASLTHPRSDYPSASCVPAELASVSPDGSTIPTPPPLNTRVMPEKIPGVWGLAPMKTGNATTCQRRYTNFERKVSQSC